MISDLVLFFVLGAMVSWGIGDFLIQRSVRKIGSLNTIAFIGIAGSLGLLPLVLDDLHALLVPSNFVLLVGMGVLTFFLAFIAFEALRIGKLSVLEVVLILELPVAIIISSMLLGEMLSFSELALIGAVLAGVLLISVDSLKKISRTFSVEKGVALMAVTGVGTGLLNVLVAVGSRDVTPEMAIWVPWVVTTFLSLAWIVRSGSVKSMVSSGNRFWVLVVATAIIDTAAWVFYALAVKTETVGVVLGITEAYVVIPIALGVMLNREELRLHQSVGILLSVSAATLLALAL